MSKPAKNKSNLYIYLDCTKVLETGSEQDIAKAKKEYWQSYKAEWRKKQRQTTKEFTIVCEPKDAAVIEDAAKRHKRSLQAFIKVSCLAYIRTQYVVPDVIAISTIRQQLAMNYNALQKLLDENMISYREAATVLRKVSELETIVLSQLNNPKTLEQLIAEAVLRTPEYKSKLIKLLQNL